MTFEFPAVHRLSWLENRSWWVQAMPLQEALHKVKSARNQANPYVDCWKVKPNRNLPIEACACNVI